MKPFRFSLQPLQILRERQEQAALHHYARTVQAAAEADARLRTARQVLADAWAARRTSGHQPVSALALAQADAHAQLLAHEAETCVLALQAAQAEVSRAFSRLLAARRQSATLEQCRRKQARAHHLRVRQHEQKELDELGRRRPEPATAAHPTENS